MKKLLKKISPNWAKDLIAKGKYKKTSSQFHGMNTKEVFSTIYHNNHWGSEESVSGVGSTLMLANNVMNELRSFMDQFKVQSLLDLPCGDFNWMNKVDLTGLTYIGADVVDELVLENEQKYGAANISFQTLDILTSPLPKVDLVLVRDCFVHFSYNDFQKAIGNLKKSGIKYLLTTSFSEHTVNYDITTGDWRPINLERPPFNFPQPIGTIIESVPEGFAKEFKGKQLALWKIAQL